MKALNKLGIQVAAMMVVLCLQLSNHDLIAQGKGQRSSRTAFTQALPPLDGSRLAVNIVEVTYGPGASSPVHSHPCPVIGYVLEGEVRTQVKGQAAAVYKAGESFYEAPNGVHLVSANNSATKPAKFVAFFVCDHNGPLSTNVPGEPK